MLHYLTELNLISVSVRLILCIICGGVMGLERQGKHRPAGICTHILVCIGAAMTMMLGLYLHDVYGSDPSRIGAQVISGIGFLGVGSIMMSGGYVRGITTAAGLWACAGMGLAIGAGFYAGALLGFAAIAFTVIFIRRFSNYYYKRHPRNKQLQIRLNSLDNLPNLLKSLQVWGVQILNTNIDNTPSKNSHEGIRIRVGISMTAQTDSHFLLVNLLQEDYVLYADYETSGKSWFPQLSQEEDEDE